MAASLAWGPLRDAHDLDVRIAAAAAIAATDADDDEAAILVRLAWTEGRFTRRVLRCDGGTTAGGRGLWQVVPRTRADWLASCGTLEEQAALALARVRESRAACAHLPARERLAVYVAGSCASARGRALSKVRVP